MYKEIMRNLIVFFVLFYYSCATPPRILESTYSEIESNILDFNYKHAVFEMTFDQDIYYSENWPCSCTLLGQDSCAGKNISNFTSPDVSNSIELSNNNWVESNVTYGEVMYFHFDLLENDFSYCPIVSLDLYNEIGSKIGVLEK